MVAGLYVSFLISQYGTLTSLTSVFICLLLSLFVRNRHVFNICVCAFFFSCGFTSLNTLFPPPSSASSNRLKTSRSPAILEGIVDQRPIATADGSRIVVRVEKVFSGEGSESVTGKLLLFASHGEVPFLRGDRIRFRTEISTPRRLGLPGEFDYHRYLALQGIMNTGRVSSSQDILLVRSSSEDSIQRRIDVVAKKLGDGIRQAVPDRRISSVLAALLLGDQKRIPRDLNDAYTKAGVNHILSVSGFHVGIISAFISLILFQIFIRFEHMMLFCNVRRTALLLTIPAMLFYLFLTGAASATARAVIMLIAFVVALYVERETDTVNVLLAAACVLVSVDPSAIFDVSFQLSFLSLWGIVVMVPFVTDRYTSALPWWSLVIVQLLAASVAASAATIIPVLYTFKVASINGIITNFLIVPLLGYGAVIAGFIVLPIILIEPLFSKILLWPSAKIVQLSNWIIDYLSQLPVIRFTTITDVDMFLFLLFMMSITFVHSRFHKKCLCIAIPLLSLTVHFAQSPSPANKLRITMLSVGQSESLLLTLPGGANMLVDGGGYLHENGLDFGQRILLPALESLGVNKIDRMVLTHDHPDHAGGLDYVMRNKPVGEFWTTEQAYSGTGLINIKEIVRQKRIPVKLMKGGESFVLPGGVILDVLHPLDSVESVAADDVADTNEGSLVFRIRYEKFSMLFTADAGFEAEYSMINNGAFLKSTVLKVGHHGSKYSTSREFIDLVQPKVALISAGFGNRFGLPSERTVNLLYSKGIAVYRTDHDGTIELESDGNTFDIQTRFRPY